MRRRIGVIGTICSSRPVAETAMAGRALASSGLGSSNAGCSTGGLALSSGTLPARSTLAVEEGFPSGSM